jgi:hypothetical protein
MALKQSYLNWFAMIAMHHARALAKNFNRAGTRTTPTKNVGIENTQCRAAQITRGNAFDKSGNINVRRAGRGTGCVKTIETSVSLNDSSLRRKRRLQLTEPLVQLRIIG